MILFRLRRVVAAVVLGSVVLTFVGCSSESSQDPVNTSPPAKPRRGMTPEGGAKKAKAN